MKNCILCTNEYVRWTLNNGNSAYALLAASDDYTEANPRKENDNVAVFVCDHDEYRLGDEFNETDLPAKLDRLVRDNLDFKDIFSVVLAGKVPGIRVKSDGEGAWNIYENYAIETPIGSSDYTEELVYEGVMAEQVYECICDDLGVAHFVAILAAFAVVKPLFLYDHSGLSIKAGPPTDTWDPSDVGMAVAFKQTIIKEWGPMEGDDAWRQKAEEVIDSEVETYDLYLSGAVYAYTLYQVDADGIPEEAVGCWYGFLGSDIAQNGIVDIVEDEAPEAGLRAAIAEDRIEMGHASYEVTPRF